MLIALFLLAQIHQSNTSGTVPVTSSAGICQSVYAGGTGVTQVVVSGSWTGTLSFIVSNDPSIAVANQVAEQSWRQDPASGLTTGSPIVSTSTNGFFLGRTKGMAYAAVCSAVGFTGTAAIRIDADQSTVLPAEVTGPNGNEVLTGAAPQAAAEAIACNSGTSPCTIPASSTAVLSANASRHGCLLQNVGLVDLYCNTQGGTASSTGLHIILGKASAALGGDGGMYRCDDAGGVNPSAIACIGQAAGASLAASAR